MAAPDALDELLATIRRLEAKVDALARARPKRLLSKRAAARLLGVDRGTTLEQLIRDGHVHLVAGKIPDTEIDRLLAEGMPEPKQRAPRRPAAPQTADDVERAIREMKI